MSLLTLCLELFSSVTTENYYGINVLKEKELKTHSCGAEMILSFCCWPENVLVFLPKVW